MRSRKLATKDLYEILGVNKGSSQDEIQSAYRKLVMQYHPDINKEPDANKKMAEINDAYNTLSDPEKRTKYDTYGEAGLNQEGFPGGYSSNAGDFFRGGGGGSIFDDLINNFFTGGTRDQDSYYTQNAGGQKVSRGSDISFETHITLEEAIAGKKIKIELDRFEACEECGGSGSKKGSSSTICPKCSGSGRVQVVQNTMFGSFRSVSDCLQCHGKGKVVSDPCTKCKGTGRIRLKKIIDLDIPPSVVDGTKIRYRGFGNVGENGGLQGDLYLYVHLKKHPLFDRQDNDLYYKAQITFPQAVLGATISIPTLYGEEKLKIPPGTESGKQFVIRSKGMPFPGNSSRKGNLTVYVVTKIPNVSQLDKDTKRLIEDLNSKLK